MSLRPANPCGKAGMAYPEVKPLFCRVPLAEFPCHALACSASSTCNSSRYGCVESDPFSFHGLQGLDSFGPFMPLLLITRLDGIVSFKQSLLCLPYPKVSRMNLALPRLPTQNRNFNRFPFCRFAISSRLRIALL